jgi:SMODS domain-containing protein
VPTLTIATVFREFKSRLELDDSYESIVQARHKAIRDCIENNVPGARTQLIGSLQRRTRIDPLTGLKDFDIDVLVELGSFVGFLGPGAGVSCDNALDMVESAIKTNLIYRRKSIEEDRPTITVPYDDGSYVEVVPAYRNENPSFPPTGRAYWIPHSRLWRLADYDYDADYISSMNQRHEERLIPCIKMLKALKRNLTPYFRSYHLEVVIAHTFPAIISYYKHKGIDPSWDTLIYQILSLAPDTIRGGVTIPGSLSEAPDSYLDSPHKEVLALQIERCAKAAAQTFGMLDSAAIEVWRNIFGSPFPSE